jgi:hypothetical protein
MGVSWRIQEQVPAINQQTDVQFIIPKAEVFFSSPAPLPHALQTIPGPSALPPLAVAGVPTDDLVLDLQDLREAALVTWCKVLPFF